MTNIKIFLIGIIATIVIELLVFYVFYRKRNTFLQVLLYVVLLNLFTWPIVQLLHTGSVMSWGILEVGVILVEGFLLMLITRSPTSRAFITSFVANAASAMIGKIYF